MNRFYVLTLFLPLFLLGNVVGVEPSYSPLHSKDGNKQILARPVGISENGILFEKKNSRDTFTAKLESFSSADQAKLKQWVRATQESAYHAVQQRVQTARPLRVLFIGNSYSFHIPSHFENIAKKEGKAIVVEQITQGGWSLMKHQKSEKTLQKIKAGKWDIVVLQEQSLRPAFPEGQRQREMYPAAKALVDTVRQAGAIPVFFQTWGRRDGDKMNATVFPNDTYDAMQKRVNTGYQRAAEHCGKVFVVPVGECWSSVRTKTTEAKLYAPDGSHPIATGNYLGGAVFYSVLFDAPIKHPDRSIPHAKAIADAANQQRPLPLPFPITQSAEKADTGR